MANIIEPPVLLSRLMTFVFATSVVVLISLFFTLAKMFPLDKTQIFFLMAQPSSELEIEIKPFTPSAENLDIYKHAFIKEYFKARNEIIPNATAMQAKWSNTENGLVAMWSSDDVFNEFVMTGAYDLLMFDTPNLDMSCNIEFTDIQTRVAGIEYAVYFRYFCGNKNDGQTQSKDYTIVIRLEQDAKIHWAERARNPMGLRVTKYKIEQGGSDPLNMDLWS